MAAAGLATWSGCGGADPRPAESLASFDPEAGEHAVLAMHPLGPIWETSDPFLFCAHHDDHYPAGNERLGPAASLRGRQLGMDFEGKDGWRMYHGEVVPGFPQHPHRGFETVTVVRKGLLDHSDSLGAAARYGQGDVQWLTAGRGINHAEMFPLLRSDADNPLELFQIWLNLPAADKMVEPRFAMFWDHTVPRHRVQDAHGRATTVTVVAGHIGDVRAPAPPPDSYAAKPDSDVAILTIALEPGAEFLLPPAASGSLRSLYFFEGSGLRIGGRPVPERHRIQVQAEAPVALVAGATGAELLVLQGRPLREPIARRGPFVMNTPEEIHQAYMDYQRTRFGGWPWDRADPVHPAQEGRFARYVDGRIDRPA